VRTLPEYLSPGVYVEEVDTGSKPIEGVSTSTVGMVGVTKKGRTDGLPQLVTSFADFERKLGGYLGTNTEDNKRFFAYAAEAFFQNGGQRLYVKRVIAGDAVVSQAQSKTEVSTRLTRDTPVVETGNENDRKKVTLLNLRGIDTSTLLTFVKLNDDGTESSVSDSNMTIDSYDPVRNTVTLATALTKKFDKKNTRVKLDKIPTASDNPSTDSVKFCAANKGEWGDSIAIEIYPASRAKSQIIEVVGTEATSTQFKLKSAANFYEGAIIVFDDGDIKQYRQIDHIENDTITLDSIFIDNSAVVDLSTPATKTVSTCEFRVVASYEDQTETFEFLTTNPATSHYYFKKIHDKSSLIDVEDMYVPASSYTETDPFDQPCGDDGLNLAFIAGDDGSLPGSNEFIGTDNGPGNKTGIKALEDIDEVSIIAAPGITDEDVQNELILQCELLKDRFAILDGPMDSSDLEDIKAFRSRYDTKYAALYFPWLLRNDPLDNVNIYVPPAGYLAGIYARSDVERGVHKAPANEVVKGIKDLKYSLNKREHDILNPYPVNINVIRDFRSSNRGIRVWGARCITSDSDWKYVNVRRLFIFIEESIEKGTQWVVFEPNDEPLWARVRRSATNFLTRVWRDGALQGSTPEEAFFVKCDRTTMTPDDINTGKLIMQIGIAPVKPAEFIIFRIGQWTGGSEVTE
jgi:phage tail sheath protein FI